MAEQFLHGVEVIEIDNGPRPIRTVKSSVIGLIGTAPDADETLFPVNTPVMIAGSRLEAAALDTVGDGSGTLPGAMDGIFDQAGAMVVVIRVEEGADDDATRANMIGGVDATSGEYTGVHALIGAQSVLGVTPRILCAPGFTSDRPDDPENPGTPLANPVVSELLGIAESLRAIIVADGPNTTDAEAVTYSADWGSPRVYIVDPAVKVSGPAGAIITQPASARVAGLIAKSDNYYGFWHSPSNRVLNGVLGTARPVDFTMGDVNSRANFLNENNVATIIREDGYRLWGNRTPSDDPKWAFLSVRRTADMIQDSLLRAHLWACDRNITKTYLEDVTESVNAYLRTLTAAGAILGGRAWPDPDLNTPANISAGKVYINFDFTPPYPAEHIVFRSHLVNDYIEEIL